MVDLFLNRAMMIAKPMAASAAATVIMKNTKICPFIVPRNVENVINTRFTEFNMSSILMKTIIAFLRINTPITPMENKRRARIKK